MPSGHWHTGLWLDKKQSAPLPQSQGFMQILLRQAESFSHSSSLTHPGEFVVSIGTQLRSVSGIQPSLQEQIIVLNGVVSTTEQMALAAQGFSS